MQSKSWCRSPVGQKKKWGHFKNSYRELAIVNWAITMVENCFLSASFNDISISSNSSANASHPKQRT